MCCAAISVWRSGCRAWKCAANSSADARVRGVGLKFWVILRGERWRACRSVDPRSACGRESRLPTCGPGVHTPAIALDLLLARGPDPQSHLSESKGKETGAALANGWE